MAVLLKLFAIVTAMAILASSGCATHTMVNLPGLMNFRFIVDNGVGDVIGRVRYTQLSADGTPPRTSPVVGARIDALDAQGNPAAGMAPTTTNDRGAFRMSGFQIGEAYFVRARLTDPSGAARELMAFVLAETRLTCVELSLASTIVAQKILVGEVPPENLKPAVIKELVREIERTLLDFFPGGPPDAGPPFEPPGALLPLPAASVAPAPVPPSPYWDCPPGAEGPIAWVPLPGGGGHWRVPAPDGPYWWVPHPGGGGCWWRPDGDGPGGAWWRPAEGRWWKPSLGAPDAGGRVWVPFPGDRGGCWWTPGPGSCACVWIPQDGGDGHRYSPRDGRWWTPAGWVLPPAEPGDYWNPPAADPDGFFSPPPGATGPIEWLSWPDGSGGYWCFPLIGGGRCYWVPRPEGGGYWWNPDASGLTPGGWWIPPRGGRPGRWWTPPCPPISGGARVWVPFPGGSGGCWWVKPPGHCSCVWVPYPGREGGWWWLSDGSGKGGSWWTGAGWAPPASAGGEIWQPPVQAGAGFWQLPAGVRGRPVWISTPDGGYWCILPTDGGDPCFWISLPGGGGFWWRPHAGSPGGQWWLPGGSGGGVWWSAPTVGGRVRWPNGALITYPVDGPGGAGGPGACGCYWVPGPGGVGGHWFMPAPNRDGGSWWRPGPGGVGGSWWPAPTPTATGPSGGSGGSGGGAYRWISLPGGGGRWWAPSPEGGPGYWWMSQAGGGGYWYVPRRGHCVCYWIPLPGGGGHWWAATPGDPAGLWWWPDANAWRAAPPTAPVGDRPLAEPGVAPSDMALILSIDRLTRGPLLAGPSGEAPIFDRLVHGAPGLQVTFGNATATVLIANAILQFKGVNAAPFPRKADRRYLLTGKVQLGCALEGVSVPTLGFAMNGKLICQATWNGQAWQASWDSQAMPDGEYFLTAHQIGADQRLGRMVAKGYARVANAPVDDPACEADWIADGPAPLPTPQPHVAPEVHEGHTH